VTVGDVIETAGGHPLPTLEHWRVRLARLGAGDTLSLGVRAGGKLRDIQMLAPAAARPPANGTALGMRLQRMSRAGSTVLGVDAGSAADRAGLEPGDLITSIGGQSSPTPLDVREAFAAALAGQPVLVGVTRGATHRVTTLSR
jgi:S1-C subfamily serine protease